MPLAMKRPAASARGAPKKKARTTAPKGDDPTQVRVRLFEAGGLRVNNESYSGPQNFVIVAPGYGKFAKAKPVELYYFTIRGLGQLPQLCCEVAGYPYQYTLVFVPHFQEHMKASLEFGRLPMCRTSDGTELVQSKAILRYVAKQVGMAGTTANDAARCDMLHEMLQTEGKLDESELTKFGEGLSLEEKGCALKDAMDLKAISRVATLELTESQKTLNALKYWEDLLGNSKSGWLLGGLKASKVTSCCYVDLALFWTVRAHKQLLEELGCTGILKLVKSVEDTRGFSRMVTSNRIMPAIGAGYVYQEDELAKLPASS
eukprot:TRINITY_DN82172_c0_g1_i1.p1 TRINITY_DN82172_c0_g1~~TRINITY_DN82172_c0_g1_i1.p1  ORF type:complete len:317 (-),score=50.17 TRINITY_DN82172_c0_g1_i1:47-997(-)